MTITPKPAEGVNSPLCDFDDWTSELFARLFDCLFPKPYFWLGHEAEWPEIVFDSTVSE